MTPSATSLDDSNEVATAVIVGSPISRALGTLFLKLSRPARPVKLFLDEEEAVRWVADRSGRRLSGHGFLARTSPWMKANQPLGWAAQRWKAAMISSRVLPV